MRYLAVIRLTRFPPNDSLAGPSRSFPAPPEHFALDLRIWQRAKVVSTKTDMTD